MHDKRWYYLGFNLFPGIGPMRLKLLIDYFGSIEKAWNAPLLKLKETGLGVKLSESFHQYRQTVDIDGYIKQLKNSHVSFLITTDEKYPSLLREISDAPFLLYIKGKKTEGVWDIGKSVAIVGTRQMTSYGEEMTKRIVEGLVSSGITIVSGLAWGIDAIAHKSAIENGGRTLAVLGCGIDIIAPPRNADLYHQIINGHGAIVSEMPLGHKPNKGLFPARNRIISGLSLGTVVIEGADDSGALITARNALEQGREVFAVPGPVTSRTSAGTSKLIKEGATLVESADDILEALHVSSSNKQKKVKASQDDVISRAQNEIERTILTVLYNDIYSIDELVVVTGIPFRELSSHITMLELRGLIGKSSDIDSKYVLQ
jgi:DNA processing protein